jgi:uncharacterized protein YrrD
LTNDILIKEYSEKIPELLSQPRVSFLIGAGCSICAGLPIMSKLTNQIYEELIPDKTGNPDEKIAYQLLVEMKNRYSGLSNISIEDILSEIQDIDAIMQRQKAKGVSNPTFPPDSATYELKHTQILLQKIKERIRDILGEKIKTIKYHRNFCRAIHYDLAKGRKRTKHPVNYFILNYDTIFEDALALESVSFNDGFVGGATAWWDYSRFGGETVSLGGNRILEARVYKLHGSIDWIKPDNSNYPIRIRTSLPKGEVIGTGEHVVIYPSSTKYKETQFDPFAQMIMNFRHYVSQTENHILTIIGYGFNDEHINTEIRDGIRNSNGTLSIIIFLGTNYLPESLEKWLTDINICSQILILGKNGIWKDGEQIMQSDKDIDWYKFEFISDLLSGVK